MPSMAWRIDEAVTHGEIDNTVEGTTSGKIWLLGRKDPLVLNLIGDCWRDLAGTKLSFTNPKPKAVEDTASLESDQAGIVGDMTASLKHKTPTVDDDEMHRLYDEKLEIPYEWRNTLYLEWFSEINGRVVIETTAFDMKISAHAWDMDEDDEEAQKLANLNAMRDFMTQVIRRREPTGSEYEESDEMDEFAWEERLKESDRLTDAYQEVLEKYMDDGDSERKEAFVMGWDGLLDAMADRQEASQGFGVESADDDDFEDGDEFDSDDDPEFGGRDGHPLQAKAQALAMLAMDLVQRDAEQGSPAYHLVSSLLQVSGKLAGALSGHDDDYEPETGYVLAVLKRCLNWLNQSVGACQELMTMEEDPDQLAALAHIRSSVFEIRDGITELRRELK